MGGGLRGVSQCAATCGDGLRSDSEVRDDGANPSTRPNPSPSLTLTLNVTLRPNLTPNPRYATTATDATVTAALLTA